MTPRSTAEASEIGGYRNGVRRYRRTGDDTDLWPFAGVRIEWYVLATDPDTIDYWAGARELDLEDLRGG